MPKPIKKRRKTPAIAGWLSSLTCMLLATVSWADEVSFSRDIQPILSDNCYQCHGPDEESRQADLRLDLKDDLLAAVGDDGDVESSELLRRVISDDEDEVMPPPSTKRSLNAAQRELLRAWIADGAKWQGHWSFQPPRRPDVPTIGDTHWASNNIDFFVRAQSEAAGLPHSPLAARDKLLRRVTFDLTGLPPTIEELDAFVSDTSPNAYEKVVQRLLASPRFGERMAMGWLDAARYADTNGYQGDRERTMWPWRDWVVDAFNRNMRFDEFTVWQLAGDLVKDASNEQKLATGFCRNHMINGEGGRIAEENRVEYVFDQIETLGTVWMGLTVQCCRCHDHKFDPMAQSEYYKLFAFFNQTPVNGGGGDPQMAPVLPVPNWTQQRKLSELQTQISAALMELTEVEKNLRSCNIGNEGAKEDADTIQKVLAQQPSDRNAEQWKQLEQHYRDVAPQFVSLFKTYVKTKDELNRAERSVAKVMVMADRPKQRRETFILNKGLYNQKLEKVDVGTPAFLPPLTPPTGSLLEDKLAGDQPPIHNRLDLAHWLVSPDHPLTARVTVNRLWQSIFGTGLVKTADDFGVQGEKPSHPKLLDWLATEFVSSGWDVKQLLRTIVTSSTYRQAAITTELQLEKDPENRLLTRGPRRRMPAWMIRDHALHCSSLLTGRFLGPSVKTYQPPGIWAEASFGNKKYQQDKGESLYRRSLYIYWRRIVGPTVFFDMAKRQTCSVKASQTNTPLHALVTLNDVTYVEAARVMASRLLREDRTDEERIASAFRMATSRHAKPDERKILIRRLQQLRDHYSQNTDAAVELTHVGEYQGLAHHEENGRHTSANLAAHTTICLMILNLDEALNK